MFPITFEIGDIPDGPGAIHHDHVEIVGVPDRADDIRERAGNFQRTALNGHVVIDVARTGDFQRAITGFEQATDAAEIARE